MKLTSLVLALLFAGFLACSDSKKAGTAGGGTCTTSSCSCDSLCKDANFTDGDEMDFGGGLVECQCSGSGDGLEKSSCETYCDQFDVSAENSLLSSENSADDKCVCDGTV